MEVIADITIEATGRARDESGLFVGRLDEGTSAGADALAQQIAAFAAGFAWSESLPIVAHGEGVGEAVIEALGPKAALQFYGSPPHAIDSHDGGPLSNRAEDFYAPSGHVDHPGFEGDRFLEDAGDQFEGTGLSIIAAFLP